MEFKRMITVGLTLCLFLQITCSLVCAEISDITSRDILSITDQALSSDSEKNAFDQDSGDKSLVVDANNQFCSDMFGALVSNPQNEGKNIFFSPFSIFFALVLAGEGARNKTAAEISSVLSLPEDDSVRRNGVYAIMRDINHPDTGIILKTANAIWAEDTYPFLPAYVTLADRYYGAKVTNLDFMKSPQASAREINSWVEEKTDSRIQNLINPNQLSDTKLIITNAIFFCGNWAEQFDRNKTSDDTFRTTPEIHVPVRMMHKKKAEYYYTETEDLQVLELPYEADSKKPLSMLIILPKTPDLSSVEKRLTNHQLSELMANMTKMEINVDIPRFNCSLEYHLNSVLSSLGMPTAFSYDTADFSGMDGTRNLSISDVVHKAFIEVDEQGTKAAAATSVNMARTMSLRKEITFRADHPFIFLIQDADSGTIFFIGRIMNPGQT